MLIRFCPFSRPTFLFGNFGIVGVNLSIDQHNLPHTAVQRVFRLKRVKRTYCFIVLLLGEVRYADLEFRGDNPLLSRCPLWPVGKLTNILRPRPNCIRVIPLAKPDVTNLKGRGHL